MTVEEVDAPPQPTSLSDEAAEQVVLGCVMLDGAVMDDVVELLRTEDFYSTTHASIFTVLARRFLAGQPLDPISVTPDLMGDMDFLRAGGAGYLHRLVSLVPLSAMAISYARTVADKAVRRRLHRANIGISRLIASPDITSDEVIDRSCGLLLDAGTSDEAIVQAVQDVADQVLFDLELPPDESRNMGLGVTDLNFQLGPSKPGNLVLVAARPGAGKTVALLQAARINAFHRDKAVLSFSLEMTSKEWVMRILCAESGVNSRRLLEQALTDDDWARLATARSRLVSASYGIVDKSGITVAEIVAHCRKFRRKHGRLDMVTVDYIQLITGNSKVNRQEQIAEIARNLKIAAKDLDCVFYVAAQLNRGPEGRSDKRPMLSDLRESGALEQDSDVVLLLFRPDYYDPLDRPNEMDYIIAKNRHGITGTVVVKTELYASRFVSMGVGSVDQ